MDTTNRSVKSALVAGCTSGIICTLFFQPLDVIKTRVQAAVVTGQSNPGIFRTIVSILVDQDQLGQPYRLCRFRNYGIFKFWSGTVPSMWRCVPGVGGYFLSLSMLENLSAKYTKPFVHDSYNGESLNNFLLGFVARSMVAIVLNPFLVVKTQIECGRFANRSMWHTFRRVYNQASWKGFYSGVAATIVRDGPYSGFYLMAYSNSKKLLHSSCESIPNLTHPWPVIAFSAVLAAVFASVLTQPADVLRTQRQLLLYTQQLGGSHPPLVVGRSPSWLEVFQLVVQTDGISGLWRGLSLRLIRRMGTAVISWGLYEHIT